MTILQKTINYVNQPDEKIDSINDIEPKNIELRLEIPIEEYKANIRKTLTYKTIDFDITLGQKNYRIEIDPVFIGADFDSYLEYYYNVFYNLVNDRTNLLDLIHALELRAKILIKEKFLSHVLIFPIIHFPLSSIFIDKNLIDYSKFKNNNSYYFYQQHLAFFNSEKLLEILRLAKLEFRLDWSDKELFLCFLNSFYIQDNEIKKQPEAPVESSFHDVFPSNIDINLYIKVVKFISGQIHLIFDIPISINPEKIDEFEFNISGKMTFTGIDFNTELNISSYQLSARIFNDSSDNEIPYPFSKLDKLNSDNFIEFDFNKRMEKIYSTHKKSQVRLTCSLYDGSILWTQEYAATDPALTHVLIEVPYYKATVLGQVSKKDLRNLKLTMKGKVVEPTGQCSLKDLTVIIQAKINKEDPVWRVVGTATTDITGSFVLPYPVGAFEAAQALVSIAPNNPIELLVNLDDTHKAALQTIQNDFLYLLVDTDDCIKSSTSDCGCHSTNSTTPRLPDQSDLISSDKYSQDLGSGSCVNLTTPNRTLSEQTYYAIVRTSDPDIANYILEKTNLDQDQDGFQFMRFSLSQGKKIQRDLITFDNPIRWQDSPDSQDNISIYQSVTVATGHLLHYKSVLKADGYSLGELLYSLPLAPGQKKQIVVYDWSHTINASEQQTVSQRENLNASIMQDRSIITQLSGVINEHVSGNSRAKTSGFSAGLGAGAMIKAVSAVLGVSGGVAGSSSSATQTSSRETVQNFNETLRQSITQSANSYREMNATVIHTVKESDTYSTTTEVIANHNHCHSLTMLYFEVLRHYAVYQELSHVEECVFVPLLMTNFTQQNIRKWKDILAVNLLPRPSDTYLKSNSTLSQDDSLVKAFDANERVLTNWQNVDYPIGRYCDEAITSIHGTIYVRLLVERPKTFFDRIYSFPIVKKEEVVNKNGGGIFGRIVDYCVGQRNVTRAWEEKIKFFDDRMIIYDNFQTAHPADVIEIKNFETLFEDIEEKKPWDEMGKILNASSTSEFMQKYFSNKTISQWDYVFYNEIVPDILKTLIDKKLTISPLSSVDATLRNWNFPKNSIIAIPIYATTTLPRDKIKELNIGFGNARFNNKSINLNIESVYLEYTTKHYTGMLLSSSRYNDMSDGASFDVSRLSSDEQRNPRKEDKFLVNELLSHLNANLEYYNKVLWYSLDPDRRYLLLDGFHIQTYDDLNNPAAYKSLASIVKNELITVVGNSLVFPVAAGVKVDRSYIRVKNENTEDYSGEDKISLFDHYKPLTPVPPYRISVPTRGIFAEALQGECDACESVKDNSSQDWEKFKTDEPTTIGTVSVPTPASNNWQAAFKDLAAPLVNIQNAPATPAPGAGLAGVSDLLGKNSIFRDVTGLEQNQKNAMSTYLSNQENVRALAEMAKVMSLQAHNTDNSDKIKSAIKEGERNQNLTKQEANELTKAHINKMIGQDDSQKLEAAKTNASKPTLTDAAIKAAEQGKNVRAESRDPVTGKEESIDINGDSDEIILAQVNGLVPKLTQSNPAACWATVVAMMVMWKKHNLALTIETILKEAGEEYLTKYENAQSLRSSERSDLIEALGMAESAINEGSENLYISLLNQHGPLWLTIDSDLDPDEIVPHARLLTKIVKNKNSGIIYFLFNDPFNGDILKETYSNYVTSLKQLMVSGNQSFAKVIHFINSENIGEGAVNKGEINLFASFKWDSKKNKKDLYGTKSWSPDTADYKLLLAKERGAVTFDIKTMNDLICYLNNYKGGKIKRINLFVHSNESQIGFKGHIDDSGAVFFDNLIEESGLDNQSLACGNTAITKNQLKEKFAENAILVIYGCKVGQDKTFPQKIANFLAIKVCAFLGDVVYNFTGEPDNNFKFKSIAIWVEKPPMTEIEDPIIEKSADTKDWRSLCSDPKYATYRQELDPIP